MEVGMLIACVGRSRVSATDLSRVRQIIVILNMVWAVSSQKKELRIRRESSYKKEIESGEEKDLKGGSEPWL
ncbi:hypothetical protein DL89DRAFT_48909 [Linderina pennispora]|uniref:Uncharacterized protein n=1 Tax=Linderina pennispora TaxID=61395 RepID=A0A1Y1W2B3_9FUNG|nr:uncharacterized protein DL89DRAFT_48909 [Linderina pennispora]ORX67690.1 hypothetical protein DL89DRAFT_48909 [Linderina pennispora]